MMVYRVWLEEIQAMCVPFDSRHLDAYLVERAVGNVRNDEESLCTPVFSRLEVSDDPESKQDSG
jgi:putative SOS response-associated peptidase YedK